MYGKENDMKITLNRIRELLFSGNSAYCKWNKKDGSSSCDQFIEIIFGFLDTKDETKKSFQQLLNSETSHDNFCRGGLRSDGYYPVKAVNEFIYKDLMRHKASPESSFTISELQSAYNYLSEEFSEKLTPKSYIFSELLTLQNCFGSQAFYKHIRDDLEDKKFGTVLAWLTIIAVFPQITSVTEKKPDFLKLILSELFPDNNETDNIPSLHEAYDEFLREKLAAEDRIEELIVARNHGIRDLMDQNRLSLLKGLIDRADTVRIIITEPVAGEAFAAHIRKKEGLYLSSYIPPAVMWTDLCVQYPGKVSLRFSPTPVIHQYTEVRCSSSDRTESFVGMYAYGGSAFDNCPYMRLTCKNKYYPVFRTEAEHLWKISQSDPSIIPGSEHQIRSSEEFIKAGIEQCAERIDLAFHAGAEWLMIDSKLDIIAEIIEKKIPCRILINDEESVKNIIPHMRSANKAYVGIAQNIRQWRDFQSKHPDIIQVRISQIPVLHAFYHTWSPAAPLIYLSYYSYDNATMHKNYSQIFDQSSAYYDLYTNEFEYLWENGSLI